MGATRVCLSAILFVFHQSQDLVPRSSHSLSWPPFWINFHPPWTNRSREFCCVPGSTDDPPFWKSSRRRPWGRGCSLSFLFNGKQTWESKNRQNGFRTTLERLSCNKDFKITQATTKVHVRFFYLNPLLQVEFGAIFQPFSYIFP